VKITLEYKRQLVKNRPSCVIPIDIEGVKAVYNLEMSMVIPYYLEARPELIVLPVSPERENTLA
jgi:hypothetical protein